MKETEESASDSLRSSVSSPGIPKTYLTPSASRHSTNTSDARRALNRRPPESDDLTWKLAPQLLGAFPGRDHVMRRLLPPTAIIAALALPAAAEAKTSLTIKGAGFGHGVGMSQYGAMGFAENGHDYRRILGHYYTDTELGRLDDDPVVRVLVQSNRSSVTFNGAARAGGRKLDPSKTYSASAYGSSEVRVRGVGRFRAPLRVAAPGGRPVILGGSGAYRGALE